ncbi:DUF4169 family protein [Jannaschia formosa]|uniref:DUF4169 family protein n=1 Tax=Jannaschia formosa TaxID=2259592 RepID=UPI000E1BBAC0|nr:DUF4169 family protein [Jannaschia formosa]TFL18524.1 DUF4169 family protein [Jannaschia formosa]
MTGKVVNLRMARKARARAEKSARADANAARHGVPKAEKTRLAAEAARADRDHEGHKRE